MMLKHFSAVKILKGKSGWWFKKCQFSVTRASAPTHSVYAAIKASAILKPLISYLTPSSNGIRKSSSIVVISLMKIMNSPMDTGSKLRFTSSKIVRGIWTVCECLASSSFSSNFSEASAFAGSKANIYSLESTTSRKFFFPDFFPGFTKLFDNLFFAHFENRGRIFCDCLSEFFKQFLCAFRIRFFSFHRLSPYFKFTMK